VNILREVLTSVTNSGKGLQTITLDTVVIVISFYRVKSSGKRGNGKRGEKKGGEGAPFSSSPICHCAERRKRLGK